MSKSRVTKKNVTAKNLVPLDDSSSSDSEPKLIQPKVTLPQSTFDNKVVLAKALDKFSLVSKDFIEAVEFYKQITSDKVDETILKINTTEQDYNDMIAAKEKEYHKKEKELEEKYLNKEKELLEQYTNKKNEIKHELKNIKINTEQELKEFQLSACEEIINKNNYVLISSDDHDKQQSELDNLKKQLEDYKQTFDEKVEKKIESELLILQEKFKQDILTKGLNHKAEIAELIAQNKQQLKEIEFLNKQIENLTNEVSEQRNLTKEIAKASSKAQIMQSFNKE